jgi:F-type H+-transporting ATPase subunit b
MIRNWDCYFIFASENEGFKFNPDILETNVINILILLIILLFTAGKFLQDILTNRYEKVLTSIQDSENRLTEATERLAEAKSQWSQARIIIEEIENETKRTKNTLLEAELNQANADLSQRFNTILVMLRYRETQVFNDIIKQVSRLALNQVISKLEKQLGKTELVLINDSKINELGGKL